VPRLVVNLLGIVVAAALVLWPSRAARRRRSVGRRLSDG
jgi:uncharacterized membrane protein YccC